MKLKQLIYTALKGQGDNPGGYRYYGVSAGVSEGDKEELVALFSPSLAVRRYVEQHSAPETLTQDRVDKEAPSRYAYLRLSSGKYCWCCVSPLARDYLGTLGGIIFHALITDEAPKFKPIALFEHISFVTALNQREQQMLSAVLLPELSVSDDIEIGHQPTDNRLNIVEAQYLISAMNRSMKEARPLLVNVDAAKAPAIFSEMFSYMSVTDTVKLTFSTLTDSEDEAKRFAVNYLGGHFDYRASLSHRSVIVADTIGKRYSDGLIVDKYARIVTDLAYHDRKHYISFLKFLSAYSLRVANYDSQRALDMYYFLIADKYLELPPDSFLNVLDDDYLRGVAAAEIAPKIEKYIAATDDKEHWLELYAGLYRFSDDRAAVSGKVVGYCFNNIIRSTDRTLREKYREILARDFDSDFYSDILAAYDGIKSTIIGNLSKANVFDLVIAILSADLSAGSRAVADRLFDDVFATFRGISGAVRDKLMPAVAFNQKYFSKCVDHLYPKSSLTLTDVLAWIDYARKNTQPVVSAAFMNRALDDLVSERIFDGIMKSRTDLDEVLKRIKIVYAMQSFSEPCLRFIYKSIDSNLLATDQLAAVLGPVRADNAVFVDALLRIQKKCGEERFTSVIYLFTKSEGVGFVKSICSSFPDIAYNIVSHNANTPERYVSIYISEFYNAGHLCDQWQSMFEIATKELSPDEISSAAVSVLSAVKAHSDAPIVTHMCALYDSLLWSTDHSDMEKVTEGLATVGRFIPPDSRLENIHLFSELCHWLTPKKNKNRKIQIIPTVASTILSDADKRAFLCRFYLRAIVAMAVVALKKNGDTFLLFVLATGAPNSVDVIWTTGFKKQSGRLRMKALSYWLEYSAHAVLLDPNHRSVLLGAIMAQLRDSDFIKLYRRAEKKKLGHIVQQLRSYHECLPEKYRAKVSSRLWVDNLKKK